MTTRVIFMGTPYFAVSSLKALLDNPDYAVVGVVTQPDRPVGRSKALQPSPVKEMALRANIPILQPTKLREPGVFEQLQAWTPDVIVVAAFGQILRQNVLDLPRYGCINVHASLLPRWRGAAPIQAVILAGDSQSGVTIMKMDAGLDTGPMLSHWEIQLDPLETGATLLDKLAELGAQGLTRTLSGYISGKIVPQPQNDSEQTYAPMLKKEDGVINWQDAAAAIERKVRAFEPWPGTYTLWNGQTLKILPTLQHSPRVAVGTYPPGQVVRLDNELIGVGTGEGVFILWSVQVAGRPATDINAFVNGHNTFIGSTLEA